MRCTVITKRGTPCKNQRYKGQSRCYPHLKQTTKKGRKVAYRKYLTSPEWKAKRQEFMESPRTSNDCWCCGRKYELGFNLHHVTYDRLGNERMSDLRMVCKPCHKYIHAVANRFNTLLEATIYVKLVGSGIPKQKAMARMKR